jgi:hypothetical protein
MTEQPLTYKDRHMQVPAESVGGPATWFAAYPVALAPGEWVLLYSAASISPGLPALPQQLSQVRNCKSSIIRIEKENWPFQSIRCNIRQLAIC